MRGVCEGRETAKEIREEAGKEAKDGESQPNASQFVLDLQRRLA